MARLRATIRPYDPSTDEAYVGSSWKENYLRDGPSSWVPRGLYYRHMNELVDGLLRRCEIRIIHNPADRDHIWGWAALEKPDGETFVHYVFIREEHRGRGYARDLLDGVQQPLNVTHWTKACSTLQYGYALLYHPFGIPT